MRRNIIFLIAMIGMIMLMLGGMFLPTILIKHQQNKLLKKTESIDFVIADTSDTEQNSEREEVSLSGIEIIQASQIYHEDKEWFYHEPVNGQLTMEVAMELSQSLIMEFSERGILPDGFRNIDFTSTKAMLGTKQYLDRNYSSINPKFSCWIMYVQDGDLSLEIYMNAVSGQILNLTAGFYEDNSNDYGDTVKILKQYMDYLGFIDFEIITKEYVASYGYLEEFNVFVSAELKYEKKSGNQENAYQVLRLKIEQ